MVYDNTSGKLIPFATLEKGQTYPVIRSYGSWWQIDVAGRIGYIRKNITQIVPKPVVNPKKKYTYQQMVKDIELLEMMYPDIIEKKIIGKSVEGRHIYAIKLGTGKKEVLINASHHAREHITTNLVMKMLDEYAYAYHKNRTIDGYNNLQSILLSTLASGKAAAVFLTGLPSPRKSRHLLWKWLHTSAQNLFPLNIGIGYGSVTIPLVSF